MPDYRSGRVSSDVAPTIAFLRPEVPFRGRIDLNTASADQIAAIPGITPDITRRIIALRERSPILHIEDLFASGTVSREAVDVLRRATYAQIPAKAMIKKITTEPARVFSGRPFQIKVSFIDSRARARLVSLRAESLDYSIHRVRELIRGEIRLGTIVEKMPSMIPGFVELEVKIYDNAGRMDMVRVPLIVFPSNPFVALFSPSGRTLRLSSGAASYDEASDSFNDNTNFFLINGNSNAVTLSSIISDQTTDQSNNIIDSGSFDLGNPIVVPAFGTVTGWYNISYPKGNNVYNRLKSKEEVRTTYSLKLQAAGAAPFTSQLTWRALLGPRINIIRVGAENFTSAQRQRINDGISFARSIYEQVDFTIGDPVDRWIISVAEAGSRLVIDDGGEAKDLTEEWTVPNDKIDVFISLDIKDASGWSPIGGPCDKDASGWSGSVIDIEGDSSYFGNSLAHEMGHYMGLDHVSDPDNFIGNNGDSDSKTGITVAQGNTMKGHCFVRFLP
jgi:hypothetical protein